MSVIKVRYDGRVYLDEVGDRIPRSIICPECGREVNVKRTKIVNHSVEKSVDSPMCAVGGQKFRAVFNLYPCYEQSAKLANKLANAPKSKQLSRSKCKCGKAIYATEDEADMAATTMARVNLRRSREIGRTATRVYKCDLGNCYHVTSSEYRVLAPV